MPTNRPRHTITEVGDVADALASVRRVAGEADIRLLVVLGADAFVRQTSEQARSEHRRAGLRDRLLARITESGGVDQDAAHAVREHGWVREPDG